MATAHKGCALRLGYAEISPDAELQPTPQARAPRVKWELFDRLLAGICPASAHAADFAVSVHMGEVDVKVNAVEAIGAL